MRIVNDISKNNKAKSIEIIPRGLQIIDGEIYMIIETQNRNLVRINPPKGWNFRSSKWEFSFEEWAR